MIQKDLRLKIRRAILDMDKPFCIQDLFYALNKKGISDRRLILEVLDELYEDELIEYDQVSGMVYDSEGGSPWAFKVVS